MVLVTCTWKYYYMGATGIRVLPQNIGPIAPTWPIYGHDLPTDNARTSQNRLGMDNRNIVRINLLFVCVFLQHIDAEGLTARGSIMQCDFVWQQQPYVRQNHKVWMQYQKHSKSISLQSGRHMYKAIVRDKLSQTWISHHQSYFCVYISMTAIVSRFPQKVLFNVNTIIFFFSLFPQ